MHAWKPAKSLHSCLTLCDPTDYSPSGSSVHGIFQARILKWFPMLSFRGSFWPRDQTHVSYVACIGKQDSFHIVAPSQHLPLDPLCPVGRQKRARSFSREVLEAGSGSAGIILAHSPLTRTSRVISPCWADDSGKCSFLGVARKKRHTGI